MMCGNRNVGFFILGSGERSFFGGIDCCFGKGWLEILNRRKYFKMMYLNVKIFSLFRDL